MYAVAVAAALMAGIGAILRSVEARAWVGLLLWGLIPCTPGILVVLGLVIRAAASEATGERRP